MNQPMCRNWQTRQTQNLLFLWTCGFESHHRHLMRISEKGFFFYCIGNFNEIPYAINKMLLKNIEQHLFIITNSVFCLLYTSTPPVIPMIFIYLLLILLRTSLLPVQYQYLMAHEGLLLSLIHISSVR